MGKGLINVLLTTIIIPLPKYDSPNFQNPLNWDFAKNSIFLNLRIFCRRGKQRQQRYRGAARISRLRIQRVRATIPRSARAAAQRRADAPHRPRRPTLPHLPIPQSSATGGQVLKKTIKAKIPYFILFSTCIA